MYITWLQHDFVSNFKIFEGTLDVPVIKDEFNYFKVLQYATIYKIFTDFYVNMSDSVSDPDSTWQKNYEYDRMRIYNTEWACSWLT